ncbi:hypothetical protein Agsp01_14490 [Agromyces sp. NBRC 114283]|nr:hypothetical protein Agsp01_14490 [Agromyces sp. NBRC 114283]
MALSKRRAAAKAAHAEACDEMRMADRSVVVDGERCRGEAESDPERNRCLGAGAERRRARLSGDLAIRGRPGMVAAGAALRPDRVRRDGSELVLRRGSGTARGADASASDRDRTGGSVGC